VIYIVALFLANSWITYGVMMAFLVLCVAVSRIPLKNLVRGMKPLLMILIFTAVLNLFLSKGETVLFSFWKITVTKELQYGSDRTKKYNTNITVTVDKSDSIPISIRRYERLLDITDEDVDGWVEKFKKIA
jgi:energy-coupling factor transporter transmembrane protein EcfT